MATEKQNLSSLMPGELAAAMADLGEPAYRAQQVFRRIHKQGARSFLEMTELPEPLRDTLADYWTLDVPAVQAKQTSADGTIKYLLRLADGNCVEAVLMRHRHGNSLCISSQIGCRMGCRFCASTQSGLARNLSAGEMAGEVYAVQRNSRALISHLVLMGIGEPLDNYDNVLRFLSLITHPDGADFSVRNISLSTCGLVPAINHLAEEKLGLTLSVSLHAADNDTRSALMPVNDAYPLKALMKACRDYQAKTGRRVSYEYALARGVNDTPEDAKRLATLLRGAKAHVNLIPLNPVDGSPYGPSDRKSAEAFRTALLAQGVNATIRRRLGADIDAACGQLRAKNQPATNGNVQQGRLPMRIAAKTDIGKNRAENQDNYRSGDVPGVGAFAVVCDGVGGAQNGRLASAVACDCMEERLMAGLHSVPKDDAEVEELLLDAVSLSNAEVFARSGNGQLTMGTTLVCAVVCGDVLHIAHVGDSRIYMYNNGILARLTRDHSMVQELMDQGDLTESEAKMHPGRNVITRALGVEGDVETEYQKRVFPPKATLLLCSDGLTHEVRDERIQELMEQTDFFDLPSALVNEALAAGGNDNITVMVMQKREAGVDA